MSEEKTHWKKLVNPDYLGSYSLQPGEEKILTIKEIKRDKVVGIGGKKQECTICFFIENEKPMILNRLNSKIITKIYGTPYIEDWKGKKIQIYVDKVDAFGETVDALRIRPNIPNTPLPLLVEGNKHYTNAVKHLSENGTIEDLKKYYTLTDEIIIKLKTDANII